VTEGQFKALIAGLGLDGGVLAGGGLTVTSPIDGATLARLKEDDGPGLEAKIARATAAFDDWRRVPAPRRGNVIRLFGDVLRRNKAALGRLITLECGKIIAEGQGEVQEMIDICDFAVGLSRQLYGRTIASERPAHRMMESWHPLGPVGVISAFNFPAAEWAWNFALAIVCGDTVLWKPSEKTPLTGLACQALFRQAAAEFGDAPDGLAEVVLGGRQAGETLAGDRRLPLISATGSCAMGRQLAPRVGARFGRLILELGGNNAIIVCPSADLDLARQAIIFGAAGTAGQRCTTTRRLLVADEIYETLVPGLIRAIAALPVGDPREAKTLVGPLIDEAAGKAMDQTLARAASDGGTVHGGGAAHVGSGGCYRHPALVEMPAQTALVAAETFAPILYVIRYRGLDQAIALHNAVPQGLSSAIFTTDLREAEHFLSTTGSDCGIANVNIGTSGAEIGGAFGGEKDTGGGRESGSDCWKSYMRRQTSTVNFGHRMPLAQGVEFDTD